MFPWGFSKSGNVLHRFAKWILERVRLLICLCMTFATEWKMCVSHWSLGKKLVWHNEYSISKTYSLEALHSHACLSHIWAGEIVNSPKNLRKGKKNCHIYKFLSKLWLSKLFLLSFVSFRPCFRRSFGQAFFEKIIENRGPEGVREAPGGWKNGRRAP